MLTQERLKELLHYDPETGIFTRISAPSQRSDLLGKVAGANNGSGYKMISIDGIKYYCHRLVWLYVHGAFPEDEIDHMNGSRSDNRFKNLRDASRLKNAQNFTKPRSDNTSGYLGVSYDKRRERWIARIKVKDSYKYLGRFLVKEDARDAYLVAKRKYHDGCTI